eukprot:TRINITY_DN18928_c0_g1_i1.p1 TRINITY_DN18928_c0_g1~~TRINITY_DN18928_c0_g1_i1.p1  ORF type:complete len:626 (+),score=254.91 TRINITY_DN18928_c0_g1_i1:55-1932(+)
MAYPGASMSGDVKLPEYDAGVAGKSQAWHIPQTVKPLYASQGALPRLPVPPVEQSLAMYLNSVRPLCTAAEYERTKKAVVDFMADPLSQELQGKLLKRMQEKGDSSWLVDWWNELSYFGYRDPVVVWVSYYFQFVRDTWSGMSQTLRAAGYIKAALKFKAMVVSETLAPEKAGRNTLDMSMYAFLFNSTRIPAPKKDHYRTFDPKHHTHVIVLRKGRVFRLETVHADGSELTVADLERQLLAIKETVGDARAAVPVGALTSENRDTWAAARTALQQDAVNEASLLAIDSSSLVVCLDDVSPTTPEEKARNVWHGDGKNRWFDKPLQIIVAENGEAGFCGEHGIMDGQPTVTFCDWVLTTLAKGGVAGVDTKGTSGTALARPAELQLNAPTQAVTAAGAAFTKLVQSQEFRVLEFNKFGKEGIKKFRVSPDAFCQMAIQLAYKRLHGEFGATYEACSTRKYLHGRTETIRSCHTPGAAFCDAMDAGVPDKQRYALLQKAAAHQSWYARRAADGNGCDRHMMGLKLMCDPAKPKPAVFTDPTYTKSSSWVLSTSALVSEHFATWGFGEVVPNGYGIGYLVKKRELSFTVSSLTTLPKPASELRAALEKALVDMHTMCTNAAAGKGKL